MSALALTLSDTLVLARRNLMRIPRQPDLLIAYTIQPVMFVLLFVYVFGGAIQTPGFDYVDFLMPGIIVQTMAFGGFVTALGLADDLKKGLIDRFRSLPMARSAVLAGRTLTDLLRGLLAVAVMLVVGLLVGFRPEGGILASAAAIGLMLLFGFALSWIGVAAGSLVRTPEALQGIIFAVVFPLTFVSSAFVDPSSMPDVVGWFAERQPMTLVIDTVRSLTLTGDPGPAVIAAILWSLVPLVVFFPIGLWLYNRRTTQ